MPYHLSKKCGMIRSLIFTLREDNMRQKWLKLGLAAAVLALLAGCFSQSVDDLYAPPKAPDDYLMLDNRINEVLSQGGEYAAPLTGELTQKVQLQDLDGDGIKEAIAFFRVSSDDRPLKIYIYRQVEEDYEVAAIIEGQGGESAINAVYYENLDGSPSKEIVVSWQVSGDQRQILSVYAIQGRTVEELVRTEFTGIRIFDLDGDGQKELAVIHEADLSQGRTIGDGTVMSMTRRSNRVELYNVRDGVLELESTAPLSQNVTGLLESRVKTGYLRDMVPAVFVPSYYGENSGLITDIFAWKDGAVTNITLDPDPEDPTVLQSSNTIRVYNAAGTDINGDGILELPDPYGLPDYQGDGTAPNFWAYRWRQFDVEGNAWPVFTTYHNEQDGWYFVLPEEWEGKLTLTRSDRSGGGERAVIFSYWEGNEAAEPVPFLAVYQLNGDNKELRAKLTGRFRLRPMGEDESETIYAARLYTDGWDCGLTEDEVKERFHLILTDLTAGV